MIVHLYNLLNQLNIAVFFVVSRLNFSDTEIEIFCAKYDRDGNFEFNLDEINEIEEGLVEEQEALDKKKHEQNKKDNDDDCDDDEKIVNLPPPTQGTLDA